MPMMNVTAQDGFQPGAYVARPDGAPRGAVVVVQEIFGVNAHIREICDRLAADGYVAIAPAIFDRIERDFQSGYSPAEVEVARGFIPRLDLDACLTDIDAARAQVADAGKVAVVGFCLGGSLAWLAATRLEGIAAASSFYGGMVQKFAGEVPRCPVQLHYGADDAGIPASNYSDVHRQHPEAEFHVYENAGHGFNCDHRASYQPEAAALAWGRTRDFLQRTIG